LFTVYVTLPPGIGPIAVGNKYVIYTMPQLSKHTPTGTSIAHKRRIVGSMSVGLPVYSLITARYKSSKDVPVVTKKF
jgi:hypothetical protein